MNNYKIRKHALILPVILFLITSCATDPYQEKIKNDTHYTKAGFFDLHVCNWPDKDLFFLAVFSTFVHKNIASVVIFRPDGSELGKFNLQISKVKKTKNNKIKNIVIGKFALGSADSNGWYKAEINLIDGKKIVASDYIKIDSMPIVTNISPGDSTAAIEIPKQLSWQEAPGAGFYKITIRDMWDDGRVIHTSKLLQKTSYNLPTGLIKPGGWYKWLIHVRDVNEDILLGDFNHGSLNTPAFFLTVD